MVLKEFSEGQLYPIFYEELLSEPKKILPLLFDFLKQPYCESLMLNKIRIHSKSVRSNQTISPPIFQWEEGLDSELLKKGIEILKQFGMHEVYQSQSKPLISPSGLLMLFK